MELKRMNYSRARRSTSTSFAQKRESSAGYIAIREVLRVSAPSAALRQKANRIVHEKTS
jgi:hypothetical protein